MFEKGTLSVCTEEPENGPIIHMNRTKTVKTAKAVRLEPVAELLSRGVMERDGVSRSGRGFGVDGVVARRGNGKARWYD